MSKSSFAKIGAIFVILVFVITNIYSYAASLSSQKSDIQDKIDETATEIVGVKKEKSDAMKQVEELDSQINSYESEISELNTKISDLENRIEEQEKSLQEEQARYDKEQELLDERLVTLYEAGETSYLDVLLSSESITDFISNYYLVSQLAEYDTDLLQKIDESKKQIENTKNDMQKNKDEIQSAKDEKQSKSDALKVSKKEKDAQVSKLSSEEKNLQDQLEEYKQAEKAIDAKLKKYEAQANQASSGGGTSSRGDSGSSGGSSGGSSASGFIRPVSGGYIGTGFYGYANHNGVDFNGVAGQPVMAAKSGVVVEAASWNYSYGVHVVISHGNGVSTLYAHGVMGSLRVSEGQTVSQGQQLMNVGQTGNATGPHLHFGLKINGTYVNPAPYLP